MLYFIVDLIFSLRELHQERKVDDKGHRENVRSDVFRDKSRQSSSSQKQPPPQPPREYFDRRNNDSGFRNRDSNPDWRFKEKRQGNFSSFQQNKPRLQFCLNEIFVNYRIQIWIVRTLLSSQ